VEPASTPRPLVQKTLRDSLPIDMLLSAVYVLVVCAVEFGSSGGTYE